MRIVALVVAAIAVTSAAAAGTAVVAWPAAGRSETPVRFLSDVVRLLAANRYAEAWQSLDPADQALAPQAAYIACETESPIPGRLVSLRVLRVGRDRIGVAATFALMIAGSAFPSGVRVVLTAHAVRAGDRWAWILPQKRRDAYRNGCGGQSRAPARGPPAQAFRR